MLEVAAQAAIKPNFLGSVEQAPENDYSHARASQGPLACYASDGEIQTGQPGTLAEWASGLRDPLRQNPTALLTICLRCQHCEPDLTPQAGSKQAMPPC